MLRYDFCGNISILLTKTAFTKPLSQLYQFRDGAKIAENTGKTYDEICADTDRDNYLSAEEAKNYGIIDQIFVKRV